MLEKIETRAAGSGDSLEEQLRVAFRDFQNPSPQPKPGGDLHEVMAGIGRHLHNESLAIKTMSDRLLAIEQQTKKRGSRGFARNLIAICIGAAVVLAWQSYGEATKQVIAAKAPELGWSPETKQMIANWVQQLGWTKPLVVESKAAVTQTAPETVAPKAPTSPSVDPGQLQQMVQSLAALRESVQQLADRQVSLVTLGQIVDQLTNSQDKIGRNIDTLQGGVAEILAKIPEPPPPSPIAAAPAVPGRPAPGGVPPSENTQNTAPTSASLSLGHDATEGALRASCGPDVQKLCGGISRQNGDVIKCLSSHRMELSPTCDAYLNGKRQRGAPKAQEQTGNTAPSRAPMPLYTPHP
jgi:hypothetical protein